MFNHLYQYAYKDIAKERKGMVTMSSFQVKDYLDKVYSNVFLVAIRGKTDLETAIRQSEDELNELYAKEDKDHNPEYSKFLVYLELLARHVGSSLIEILYLRELDRDYILQELLDSIYKSDSDVKEIGNNMDNWAVKFSIPFSDHVLSFERVKLTKPPLYRLILNRANSQYHSVFFPQEVCIESSRNGYLGDFIERVLRKHQEKITECDASITQLINNSAGTRSKKQDDSSKDELVVYVDSDTKTVDILDRFEGYGEYKGLPAYKRIVISNPKCSELIGYKWIGYNLVIERSNSTEYVGDITFTEFKQKNDDGLREHIRPYLLRAQNSSNRVGYGWQWDWSGGYGDYIEGTEYGETTNYVFSGAYITSEYTYNPKNRISFYKNNEDILDDENYQIVPYEGAVTEITKNDIQKWYALTGIKGLIKTYTPVYLDCELHKIYVPEKDYKLNNVSIIQDKLVLHPINGFKDKEIRLLPGTKEGVNANNHSYDKNDACSKDNATNLKGLTDVKYSIRPYTGSVKSITNNKTVSEYVLVKKDNSSKGYIPVIADDIDRIIYIYKPFYEDYKDSFNVDILQLCSINGTDTRKLAVSSVLQTEAVNNTYKTEKQANHVDTYERSNDIGAGNDDHNGKNESDAIVKKQKATVIKVLKSGDMCPDCGKPNSTPDVIKVVDTKGNSRFIVGTQCSCGTIYLTKKQYKKIHSKTYLEIYEVNAPKSIKPVKKKTISKYSSYTPVNTDKKMISNPRGCKKCGKTPIAAGALSKGLQLCWECYKEEISSMFDY